MQVVISFNFKKKKLTFFFNLNINLLCIKNFLLKARWISYYVNIDKILKYFEIKFKKNIKKILININPKISSFIKKTINLTSDGLLDSLMIIKFISEIENLIKKKNKIITMIGFQLRFNPIIQYLENILKRKSPIGRVLTAHIHHGEHIKDFHPYEDYRISYAAIKNLGGGVILTQIHEIDYLITFIFKLI